jgi:di/tricarboxylate transporter
VEVYQPPTPDSSRPEPALQADDIERSKAKPIVGAAAAAMVVGGIGAVLLSLQMLTGFRVRGLLAVLFGCNLCYATPMAYQTNLLVMTAAGYRFNDFVRAGLPLTILMWVVLTWLLAKEYALI